MLPISNRFRDAVDFTLVLHAEHRRKSGTDVPYACHLFGVASLVMEHGGDEDESIAALLHDAVEDQGGAPTLEKIRERFGDRVAMIVAGCTDTDQTPKPPWRQRKETYIAHLDNADPSVRLVSCCDKLHNARAIVRDQHNKGDDAFKIFTGKKDGTLWYYRALSDAFNRLGPAAVAPLLKRTVDEMHTLAAEA